MRASVTIVGPLLDRLGLTERVSLEQGRTRPKLRRRFDLFDPAQLRRGQPPAALTIEHGGEPIGSVLAYERTRGGDIECVAVSDALVLLRSRTKIFFSAELWSRSDGSDLVITGVSLVKTPAMNGLRPIEVYAGDCRLPECRSSWRLDEPLRSRVERAGIARRWVSDSDPLMITGPLAKVQQIEGGYLIDDELVSTSDRQGGRPLGELERWPAVRGSVLRVS
jgi:hypothetical protein